MEKFKVKLQAIHQETPTIKRFVLDLDGQDFHFLPGQWIDFFVNLNQQPQAGGYSLISAPLDPNPSLEIAVKASEHPVTRYLHTQAQVGETFEISQAQGACVFDPEMGEQIVLIAGGIGITPLLSIFRTIRDQYPETHVALVYSAHTPEELAFSEEIRAAAEEYEHVLAVFSCTDPACDPPDWVHFQERIDSFFLKTMNFPKDAHYFLCGPTPMIQELEKSLVELGVGASQIHAEKW